MEEGIEVGVLIAPALDAVVGDRLPARLHVGRARAGIVGANLAAGEAAQQLGERLARHLAEDVPERDVDGGIAAHLGAGRGKADIAGQAARDGVDGERVPAEKERRGALVDIGLDGAGTEEGLPQAGDSLIGMDQHPAKIGVLVDPDSLDTRDLQDGILS